MKISTFKSEAMVLSQKMVKCPLKVGEKLLSRMDEFKYLWVLLRDGQTVTQMLYWSIVVRRELSHKAITGLSASQLVHMIMSCG